MLIHPFKKFRLDSKYLRKYHYWPNQRWEIHVSSTGSTYVTLFKLYLQKLFESYPLIETNVREGVVDAIIHLNVCDPTAKNEIQKVHNDVLSLISSKDFQNSKKAFDSQI